jgi:HAMP domain-containing protein
MKLVSKFTLIFVAVFGIGLAISAYFSFRFLEHDAREHVLQQARLMMEAASSMRHYTTTEIRPLLDTPTLRRSHFYPQTIPAYAATQSFNALRSRGYPDYLYREAVLNPTNLRDRPLDWEADVIASFRNFPDRTEIVGERDTPNGRSLFLAHPIKAPPACLECHSTPGAAPVSMIRIYGNSNGFGWKPNEVVGAQIVSVPMALAISIAKDAFGTLMVYLVGVLVVTAVVLDLVLFFTVVRPVSKLSALADEISLGKMDVPELPVRGSDEISKLAGSFNRMYISLAKAVRLLEES